jgi:uncharacterized YccA/Bax inhibitor family protein
MAKRSFFSSSGNPFMREEAFQNNSNSPLDSNFIEVSANRMTVSGAVNKTFILFGLMLLTSVASYVYANPLFIIVGAVGGLIAVLIASFKPHTSATVAPIYALLEGLFVGSVSAYYGGLYGGIVFNAISLTFGILFAMLFIYKTGIIKVTDKLRTGVIMATAGIALVYLLNIILGFFGISVPYLHQGGAIGIGISVVIIGVAAFNLLLDFDNFDKGERYGAPAYMEWYLGMGLLITLVWLYIELLRLLSILSSRD